MTLTADWLCTQVANYFAAQAIMTPVVYGSEQDGRYKATSTRVVVGLEADGEIAAAGPPGAPGHRMSDATLSSRAIYTDRASIAVWIRGVCDPGTAESDRVRASQAICKSLLHHVLRAIHAPAYGSLNLGNGAKYKWSEPATQDAFNGALLKLSFRIDIPVEEHFRPRIGLAKPSAPSASAVNVGLDEEACDATHCEPVTSTA